MLKELQLDKNIPVPLYYQLKTELLDRIKNGKLKSGDMIPTEMDISEALDISRTTVRQAITDLVKEGYLYRVKSKGTFVARPKLKQTPNNTYNSYSKAVLDSGRILNTFLLQNEMVEIPEELVELGLGKKGEKCQFIYRKRLADNDPLYRVYTYLNSNIFPFVTEEMLKEKHMRGIMDANEETSVYRQRRKIEAVSASKEDIAELEVEDGDAIQKVTTFRYNESGELLDVSIAYFRGDMNVIEVDIVENKK